MSYCHLNIDMCAEEAAPLLELDEGREDKIRPSATFLWWNATNSGTTLSTTTWRFSERNLHCKSPVEKNMP